MMLNIAMMQLASTTRLSILLGCVMALAVSGTLAPAQTPDAPDPPALELDAPIPDLSNYHVVELRPLAEHLYRKVLELQQENRILKAQIATLRKRRGTLRPTGEVPSAVGPDSQDLEPDAAITPSTSRRIAPFTYLPCEAWVGHQFIFLPRSKYLQKYGYQGFSAVKGQSDSQPYEDLVGQIGTVTDIHQDVFPRLTIKMNDGKALYVTAYTASAQGIAVKGIALVADLHFAREKWKGKTLWLKAGELTTYDEESKQLVPLQVRRYSPVEVLDVRAGWYENKPARVVCLTQSGDDGFVDVTLSGTNSNVSNAVRFDSVFFDQDPREKFPWEPRIWRAIERGKVLVGMEPQQVIFAWGKPTHVAASEQFGINREQWIYGEERHLIFEDGLITLVQE